MSDFRLKLHLNKSLWYLNQIAGGESGSGWFFLQRVGCITDPVALGGSFVTTDDVTGIIWI